MKRSLRLLLVGAALAASVAPVAARATHCTPGTIIFSGADTGQTDPNGAPIRPGPNGSLAGCQVEPTDESLAVIWPGATHMVVAYTLGSDEPTGTLTFNGVETELAFTYIQPLYATSKRWESQSVPTVVGTGPVTATIFVDGEEVSSVTYQKYA